MEVAIRAPWVTSHVSASRGFLTGSVQAGQVCKLLPEIVSVAQPALLGCALVGHVCTALIDQTATAAVVVAGRRSRLA